MAKKEKTWILRGTVRGFEKKDLGEFGQTVFLGMEVRLIQSGNAKGYPCTDWIDVSAYENAQRVLSEREFYKGQDIIVWVKQETDETDESTYTLKRVQEQTREFISGVTFLEKFI